MPNTKRSPRRKFDFYPTSEWMVRQLLNNYPAIQGNLLEPCAGENDIARVLAKEPGVNTVTTNDLDPARMAHHNKDARRRFIYEVGEFDWIVTNPPFSDAMEILDKSYIHAKRGVAFLLRLSFLEPTFDRGPWLQKNPPTSIIVLPRYSFTGNGKTDSVTCAWMVWDKEADFQEIQVVPRQQG